MNDIVRTFNNDLPTPPRLILDETATSVIYNIVPVGRNIPKSVPANCSKKVKERNYYARKLGQLLP